VTKAAKTNVVEYFGGWDRQKTRLNKEGNITPMARKVFTNGQCHALALALHEEAGLPLVGFWTPQDTYNPENEDEGDWNYRHSTPSHCGVRLPSGAVLDIDGPGAECRWSDSHQAEVYPVTMDEMLSYEERDYLEPNIEAAKPFAKTLLAQLGIIPGNVAEDNV
jgi:hypothetical protein